MVSARFRLQLLVAAFLSVAWITPGCGSTAAIPSAPSPVSAPPAQYPSLLGDWGGGAGITLAYSAATSPGASHCDASAGVREQSEGTFAGRLGLNGSSLNTDKQCPSGFGFTASMTPDGIITSFRADTQLGSHECVPVSDPEFSSGTASSTGFRVVITDRALCRWPALLDSRLPQTNDTGRTFTITIDRRRS
jgi:hypothetical protein